MTYATLMVQLALGQSNTALLQIAGDLAERFHASVIGIAACQPLQVLYGDGYFAADLFDQERDEDEKEIRAAEVEFREALHARANNVEWRSMITFAALSNYLSHEARCADLFITNEQQSGSLFDPSRSVNMSDLVMELGRPVLVVPTAVNKFKPDCAMIGWKDTRETRRAIVDALPLLKEANRVIVVEIAAEDALEVARGHLKDVVGWLKQHCIGADSLAMPSIGDDAARLNVIAEEQRADLIVAGAYGHSRLREWVLGGVTRDVLLHAKRCSLVSH
jgi:nucleotide-binding universal stress UspA family protein